MKFPITRESLQVFDPVMEKKEKDAIVIQNHINSLVKSICQQIEERMSYGIPKLNENEMYRQQTIHNGNMREAHKKIMNDKRFIWEGLAQIQMTQQPMFTHGVPLNVDKSILIERLIEKLKENFIGCDIIIDPLKTYLIIDWS
jgi:hypothetical protein